MIVKLLTEYHLEFLSLKEAAELHMSKCHIAGNLMPRLISIFSSVATSFSKIEWAL